MRSFHWIGGSKYLTDAEGEPVLCPLHIPKRDTDDAHCVGLSCAAFSTYEVPAPKKGEMEVMIQCAMMQHPMGVLEE